MMIETHGMGQHRMQSREGSTLRTKGMHNMRAPSTLLSEKAATAHASPAGASDGNPAFCSNRRAGWASRRSAGMRRGGRILTVRRTSREPAGSSLQAVGALQPRRRPAARCKSASASQAKGEVRRTQNDLHIVSRRSKPPACCEALEHRQSCVCVCVYEQVV